MVTNHGLVGAMDDNFDGQFGAFHDFAQLFEGELVGGRSHGQAVFLQELGGQMVEKVK